MSITTEEAEALAEKLRHTLAVAAFDETRRAAEALRALAAERDQMAKDLDAREIAHMATSVGIDSLTECLEKSEKAREAAERDLKDQECANEMLRRFVDDQRVSRVAVESRAERAEAKAERLREALTPSGGTKAEYMGEFSFGFPVFDEDGNEATRNVNVPWTTIKEIMAAIRARAALGGGKDADQQT